MGFGKHMVTCATPPSTPNLKWATWELKQTQWYYTHQRDKFVIAQAVTGDELRANWIYWRGKYCALAPDGATYKDLDGTKLHCN